MVKLRSIIQYFDSLLEPASYRDMAFNGLQVESRVKDLKTVAFAVDAGHSVMESAVEADSQLLVVHHGIFWGQSTPIAGAFGRKIDLLLRNGCSLYASHLPLDGNREVGNGFELARFLGLEGITGFFEIEGVTVGALGSCPKPVSLDFFIEKCSEMTGAIEPVILPFGPKSIEHVAVVTGSGSQAIELCAPSEFNISAREGLRPRVDLLISGEPKQESYHLAKELGVNALFAGHYATETFGVRALQRKLEQDFDIETCFIDEPTGI